MKEIFCEDCEYFIENYTGYWDCHIDKCSLTNTNIVYNYDGTAKNCVLKYVNDTDEELCLK